ncbi:MAG: hypothetical protein GXY81_08270 [Candidatus Cloacimonetes bacterium]|nr:hypothetical protein [Candidatus Cloacimonadota bacterium]
MVLLNVPDESGTNDRLRPVLHPAANHEEKHTQTQKRQRQPAYRLFKAQKKPG